MSSEELGKPANADLKLGLATAPVIYAALEYPELIDPIRRNFSKPDDVYLVSLSVIIAPVGAIIRIVKSL